MKYLSSPFIKAFVFALCYGIGFYILQFFFAKTGIFSISPNSTNLKSWDVGFYDSIREAGYNRNSDNTGFFILFPLIWKITHFGIWGISALNIVFFSLGFAFLMRTLRESDKVFWLFCLTLPPVYFEFLPYTESLFFLLGSLAMFAIKEKKLWLIWISLFLISLVRATAVFLLPALLAMEILSGTHKDWWKNGLQFLYKYALPTLLGLAVFILWQYMETGLWFVYFKKQADHWGHTFAWPSIPFSNIENGNWRYHWLSAAALLINATALLCLVRQAVLWLKNSNNKNENLLFSMGYLTMVLIFILCLNPRYGNQTNVMGANRYTFATPFCFYFLHYFYKQRHSPVRIIYFFLFASGFWYLFGAYNDINSYFMVGLIPSVLIIMFMMHSSLVEGHNSWLIIALIAFNFLIQAHFFQQFITPLYMD